MFDDLPSKESLHGSCVLKAQQPGRPIHCPDGPQPSSVSSIKQKTSVAFWGEWNMASVNKQQHCPQMQLSCHQCLATEATGEKETVQPTER